MLTYNDLLKFNTYADRFDYLKLRGFVGSETFGYDRYLNQTLYRGSKWKRIRDLVIVRDNGCDLGVEGYSITGKILVHHMNVLTLEQIENDSAIIYDPQYLITVSNVTHQAIHYGRKNDSSPYQFADRRPNDTIPWKR